MTPSGIARSKAEERVTRLRPHRSRRNDRAGAGVTRRPWPAPALVIMLFMIVGAGPDPPKITKMEIVPSLVVVGSDPSNATSFEVEVRLWTGEADRVSIVDGYQPQWTPSETWVKLVS